MGVFSSPPGGERSDTTDPVSWLQIEQGRSVVTSDGVSIGSVAQVEGDKQDDIFDGLAVEPAQPGQAQLLAFQRDAPNHRRAMRRRPRPRPGSARIGCRPAPR